MNALYVSLITMFTEECFACLISLIFIIDGFKKIFNSMDSVGVDCEDLPKMNNGCVPLDKVKFDGTCSDLLMQPGFFNDTICAPKRASFRSWNYCSFYDSCKNEAGYFSILLSLLTLLLAFGFQALRKTNWFATWFRTLVCNFGVVITIGVCLLVDRSNQIATKKLQVPSSFTTSSGRNWLVDIGSIFDEDFNKFAFLYAIPTGSLCCILIFLDQQITAVICNRSENNLKKGFGYHLDLAIIALLLIPCGLFGLPWYVAATVRSIAHIQSLKQYDTKNAVPGQSASFMGVLEQRATGLLIFVLIGTHSVKKMVGTLTIFKEIENFK